MSVEEEDQAKGVESWTSNETSNKGLSRFLLR